MAVAELTLIPIGEGIHLSKYIADAENVLARSNLEYEITSMGTNIEGDLDEIFAVIKKMQESVFDSGAKRVYSVVKIDDRRQDPHPMKDKVKAVKDKMK